MAELGHDACGVPVVRLGPVEPATPGARFLAARGTLAGEIRIGANIQFTDDELDEMLDAPVSL
ncbi:hypothetical protein [Nocardioides nanhaiensis]|uniref:Uncharacterized protein n=1 Tax=Nocardioides nanhaiensis TaxID=1476871 RepID=A0ABP8WRI8_9ACTN